MELDHDRFGRAGPHQLSRPGNGSLKVAHCSNAACSSASTATIDGVTGGHTSITIGSDGLGLVSYEDVQGNVEPLKIAHCSNIACSEATTTTIDPDGDLFGTAITTGVDGLGLVTFNNQTRGLGVVHCSNVFCVPYFRRR